MTLKVFLTISLASIALMACSSRPKPGTDNLAPVFRNIVKRQFNQVASTLEKSAKERDGNVWYLAGPGPDDFGTIDPRRIEKLTTELQKALKYCDEELKDLPSQEFDYLCLSNSDGTYGRRPLPFIIGELETFSKVSLKTLYYDQNKIYKSEMRRQKNESIAQEAAQKAEMERDNRIKNHPKYQACQIKDLIKYNQKEIQRIRKSRSRIPSSARNSLADMKTQAMMQAENAHKKNITDLKIVLHKNKHKRVKRSECQRIFSGDF